MPELEGAKERVLEQPPPILREGFKPSVSMYGAEITVQLPSVAMGFRIPP